MGETERSNLMTTQELDKRMSFAEEKTKYSHLTVRHKDKGRTLVRLTQETTPSQVLEMACAHWHLSPDKYILMFRNSPVWGNLALSLWNVPRTATLDLAPKTSSSTSDTSDGLIVVTVRDKEEVFTDAFDKSETLLNVMKSIYPKFNLVQDNKLKVSYLGSPLSVDELLDTKVLNLNLKKQIVLRIVHEDESEEKNAGDGSSQVLPSAVRHSQSSVGSQNSSKLKQGSIKSKSNNKKKAPSTRNKNEERPLSRSKLLDRMGLVYKKHLRNSRMTEVSTESDGDLVSSESDESSCSPCLIYMETIIRVIFPSGYVLQGVFSPMDRIKEVNEFLNKYLIQKTDFKLYNSSKLDKPLDPDKNLFNLQLVPVGKLYFATEDTLLEPWREKVYLKDEVIKTAVTPRVASITGDFLRSKDHNSSITIELSSELETQLKSSSETLRSEASKVSSASLRS